MNVYVDRDPLKKALAFASKVKDAAAVVDLDAKGSSLRITVQTPKAMAALSVACNADEDLQARVSLSGLLDAVSRLPEATVRLVGTAREVRLESGRAVVRVPVSLDAAVTRTAPIEEELVLTCGAGELRRALKRVAHAVALDDSRYGLNGVDVRAVDGRVRLAAADGHRLSVAMMVGEVVGAGAVLVAHGAIGLIQAALDQCGPEDGVKLRMGAGWSSLEIDGLSVEFLGIDGTFPEVAEVIPKLETAAIVRVDRATLLDGLAAAALSEHLEIDVAPDALTLRGSSSDGRAASVVVPCELEGKPYTFGVQPTYLADALKVCTSDVVTIHQGHALGPLRVHEETDDVLVVMPRRVQ